MPSRTKPRCRPVLVLCTLVRALASESRCATLLQRKTESLPVVTEVPLIHELAAEGFHHATSEDYRLRSCQELSAFRNRSWLPLVLSGRQSLEEKAQEQLQLAHNDVLTHRHDLNGTLLLQLRQKEEQRWSQDQVQLSLFNPSMVPLPSAWQQSPDERWLASFRHMELSSELNTNCLPMALSNVMLLTVLDADFRPTRPAAMVTYQDVLPEHFQCQTDLDLVYLGPEDPRLFVTDRVMMLYTSKRPSKDLRQKCHRPVGRMYIAEVMEDLSVHGHKAIPFVSEQQSGRATIGGRPVGRWEKNWGPFFFTDESGNRQILVEEDMHPHIILSMDDDFVAGEVVYNTTSPFVEEWIRRKHFNQPMKLHGGVAPVLFTEPIPGLNLEAPFYISIVHTRLWPSKTKEVDLMIYESYLCAFEAKPPFTITRVGEKLLPLQPQRSVFYFLVAFPTQMMRVAADGSADAAGDQLMILYGAGDATSRMLRLPVARLPEFL